MAKRLLPESILRGTLDNTRRGIVDVSIWLHGLEHPLHLSLLGHTLPDIAGCRVDFSRRPDAVYEPYEGELPLQQKGNCGEITASRKVRILQADLPEEERDPMKGPNDLAHVENILYLEWFTPELGRLVLEGQDMTITVSDPTWTPTEEDKRQAIEGAEAALQDFIDQLCGEKAELPEGREMDEFEWELHLQESDRRTDALMELIDRFGQENDAMERAGKFMGWEEGEDLEDEEEDEEEDCDYDDEENEEGDSDSTPHSRPSFKDHPLYCRVSAILDSRYSSYSPSKTEEYGPQQQFDIILVRLISKLAGALDGLFHEPDDRPEAGMLIAMLKRELLTVEEAIRLFEPAEIPPELRDEVFLIRENILQQIDSLRHGEW